MGPIGMLYYSHMQVYFYVYTDSLIRFEVLCMYVVYGISLYTQQETATQEQSLLKTRESQLEDKVKTLEAMKSELETESETLQKQLEKASPSDTDELTKVPALALP